MQLYHVLAEVAATCPEHDRIISQRLDQLASPSEWSFELFGRLWDAAVASLYTSHAPCLVIHRLAELAEWGQATSYAPQRASGGLRSLPGSSYPRNGGEALRRAA
jgi:hypothetical protein